ncbi:hypothetical protein HG535_0A00910 [Zygotorulaspora mrakii]|uniref:Uncharacterized protein n=1 Tax=Zygotorulaspora mrakii TaxID=42260 RepID=A0A7H9AX41_ZYGMR|nr:uncharacterized protein HG535_0A00910 [Zygotorulaspora mrakii]QLG70152.1 hypothetical protein HG535_0A00910 [Zygotorulaspora mrakii]
MIPPPVDPALLHEHAYQGTGDLSYALNIETFTDEGGYKPLLKYGLGFFNYYLALDDEVYGRSWLEIFRFHLYEHFAIYFLIFLVAFLAWSSMVVAHIGSTSDIIFHKSKGSHKKRSEDGDSLDYHHLKV